MNNEASFSHLLATEYNNKIPAFDGEEPIKPLIDNPQNPVVLDDVAHFVLRVVFGAFFDIEDVLHDLLGRGAFYGGLASGGEDSVVLADPVSAPIFGVGVGPLEGHVFEEPLTGDHHLLQEVFGQVGVLDAKLVES